MMWDMALPALFVIFVWWASTGVLFILNGLPERTYATSLSIVALLAVVALGALWSSASGTSRMDAALTLVATLTVWAMIEMSFLMGVVTGPRPVACPAEASGWQRFQAACLAIAYHEAALVLALVILWTLTSGAPNTMGMTTFALLWLMRLSTKFNIFLGVPNTAAELLPARISFLKSYFRQSSMSFLFPLSVTAATVVTGYLMMRAWAAPVGSFEASAQTMMATLAALGLLEHWFLVLPIRPETLWGWSLSGKADVARPTTTTRAAGGQPLLPRMHTPACAQTN